MPETLPQGEKLFRGIAVSGGVCRGKILVLAPSHPVITRQSVSEAGLAEEINRLEKALVQTRQQILEERRPLGHILQAFGVRHSSRPGATLSTCLLQTVHV